MKGRRILIGAVTLVVLTGAGLMMTAAMGKAKSYSTDIAKYNSISEEVEATGDVHGENSKTNYSTITAPVAYFYM